MDAAVDELFKKAESLSDQALAQEIERRLAEYRAGRMQSVGWTELRARLHRAK